MSYTWGHELYMGYGLHMGLWTTHGSMNYIWGYELHMAPWTTYVAMNFTWGHGLCMGLLTTNVAMDYIRGRYDYAFNNKAIITNISSLYLLLNRPD